MSKTKKTHLAHFLTPLCVKSTGKAERKLTGDIQQVDCRNCLNKLKQMKYVSESRALLISYILTGLFILGMIAVLFY